MKYIYDWSVSYRFIVIDLTMLISLHYGNWGGHGDKLTDLYFSLKGVEPKDPVDLYQHNLQAATRAFRWSSMYTSVVRFYDIL